MCDLSLDIPTAICVKKLGFTALNPFISEARFSNEEKRTPGISQYKRTCLGISRDRSHIDLSWVWHDRYVDPSRRSGHRSRAFCSRAGGAAAMWEGPMPSPRVVVVAKIPTRRPQTQGLRQHRVQPMACAPPGVLTRADPAARPGGAR